MRLFLDLYTTFLKVGAFTLGGGYAMLPLIEREVVDRKKWIEGKDFLNVLAIAQSLPGPIALNTAVFVGYKIRGIPGALVTSLGVITPSFACMVMIASFFVGIKDNPVVAAVFAGIRPAVVALIAGSVWSLGKRAQLNRYTLCVVLAAAAAVWLAKISPAWVVLALALAGSLFPVKRAGETAATRAPEQSAEGATELE